MIPISIDAARDWLDDNGGDMPSVVAESILFALNNHKPLLEACERLYRQSQRWQRTAGAGDGFLEGFRGC